MITVTVVEPCERAGSQLPVDPRTFNVIDKVSVNLEGPFNTMFSPTL